MAVDQQRVLSAVVCDAVNERAVAHGELRGSGATRVKRVVAASGIAMLFMLVACGGGDSTAEPAPGPPATGAPTPSPNPPPPVSGSVINANPSNYLDLLSKLRAGDTLVLASGNYDVTNDVPGLPIFNLNGEPSKPIIITGPETGPRPVLLGRATHNTVRFSNASYIIVRNIEIDGRNLGGDGVATQGQTHNITLENLVIRGVGDDQQTVGISTVGFPTWNWVIRRCTIIGAGTGMYLGNSNGGSPFVNGLIEHNLLRDTIGYNMQIKRQNVWSSVPTGIPTGKTNTIIRHNVFSKSGNSSTGALARPNVLVGDQPPSGPGAENGFEIYGNFFYQNPSEGLFQGSGNVAFYGNVMVNDSGGAATFQQHEGGVVRNVRMFGNTIVARGGGVSISGGAVGFTQSVVGNAIFAATPVSAPAQSENVTDTYASAANYVNNATGALGQLDLFPKAGALRRTVLDATAFSSFTDADRDFNRAARTWAVRGAYNGEGANPGWTPRLEIKP